MPSVTLKDVDQHKFVKAFSAFLKKTGKMKVPDWVDIVKSGRYKELAPYDQDWYYTRCAAIVRHIYFRSPVGVGAVTKMFGGRKRNGVCPAHFCRSAGGVARKALQSLEQIKLIEKSPDGGRKLTVQEGLTSLEVNRKMIVEFRNASSRRKDDLKSKKEVEKKTIKAKKRAAVEIKSLELKKQKLFEEKSKEISEIETKLKLLKKN